VQKHPTCDQELAKDVMEGMTDEIAITITSITQDEPVTRRKDDHTAHGDGRVYAIHFDADDGNGGSCSGTVNVSVPMTITQP
jgi:hypothetical protein